MLRWCIMSQLTSMSVCDTKNKQSVFLPLKMLIKRKKYSKSTFDREEVVKGEAISFSTTKASCPKLRAFYGKVLESRAGKLSIQSSTFLQSNEKKKESKWIRNKVEKYNGPIYICARWIGATLVVEAYLRFGEMEDQARRQIVLTLLNTISHREICLIDNSWQLWHF